MIVSWTSWRRTALFLALALTTARLRAGESTFEVAGVVRDDTGRAVAGARVAEAETGNSTETDAAGGFRLRLTPGPHTLQVSAAGRERVTQALSVTADVADVGIALGPPRLREDVVVRALRADLKTPVTKTDLGREEIARASYGQEIPFLLKDAPAVTQYSETGIGAGYAYLYLRGIHQTRLNLTLDGVPLSEAEDSALYFADFEGLAGSLESVQIQRGVGTSSVGAASFGGSLNFESVVLGDKASATGSLSAGSFATHRYGLAGQTGQVGPGLAFYGRVFYADTDGFRDNSGVLQHTVFFGARRTGDRSMFKLFGFSGREKTQEAFLAVEKDVLEQDLRANPLSPAERDRFGQDFVQAQWTRILGGSSTLSFQAFYNGAQGWYRLFADADRTTLQQYGLDWRYVGGLVTFDHARGPFGLTAGAHANDFESRHTRDVVGGGRDYENHGFKNEASAFVKAHYDLGRARLYGDAQVRHATFRYEGDIDLGSVDRTFFNPKVGARFTLRPTLSLYASAGRTTREPTRSDLFTGEDNPTLPYDLRAVRPERVTDYEAGLGYSGRRLHVQADVYAMEFRNEIALTGELSEIGLPLRRNVDRSHRRGVELEVRYEPTHTLRFTATANASSNRIATWTQAIDVYDADGAYSETVLRTYHDVRPLLTPRFVGNVGADYAPTQAVAVGLAARYVSRSQLDNTDNPDTTTPAFFNLDGHLTLDLSRFVRKGNPRLRVQANNLLDNRRQWPSGYSYLYFDRDAQGGETLQGTPYYYPQATRSVFVSLDVRF